MSKIFAIVGVAIFAGATLLWFNSPYTSSVETTRQNYVSVDDDKITTQDASGAIETPVVEPKSLSTGSEATLIVLPKLQAESAVKSKLCSDVKDGCIARTDLVFGSELASEEGHLKNVAAGVLLQSTNFSEVFQAFDAQKQSSEEYESETQLEEFVRQHITDLPSANAKVSCISLVCIAEIDADPQTDLKVLNKIVAANDWPMGSVVIVPSYQDYRLKYRVLTSRVQQPNSGLLIQPERK